MNCNDVVVTPGTYFTNVTVHSTDKDKQYVLRIKPYDVVDVVTELIKSLSNAEKTSLLFNLGWER